VNFNDLESVRAVCETYPVAGLITEPVLQNIGVVPPRPGYLEGLKKLAAEFGFVLVFDEVKTGFRHGFGGYSAMSGVTPDLVIYGKALATDTPSPLHRRRSRLMDYFVHPDPAQSSSGGAQRTPRRRRGNLRASSGCCQRSEVYRELESLAPTWTPAFARSCRGRLCWTCIALGSTFCLYFMNPSRTGTTWLPTTILSSTTLCGGADRVRDLFLPAGGDNAPIGGGPHPG
jgi:glutamate-1-semialdehyde 2,1-aminomutase